MFGWFKDARTLTSFSADNRVSGGMSIMFISLMTTLAPSSFLVSKTAVPNAPEITKLGFCGSATVYYVPFPTIPIFV